MAKATPDAVTVCDNPTTELSLNEYEKLLRDRRLKLFGDVFGFASAYDNAIVLAGYGAFFALWAGVSHDVGPLCRAVTVSLMGMSLLFYIVWHLITMLNRQRFEFQKANSFKLQENIYEFNQAWLDIETRQTASSAKMLRLWPYVFVPAVFLGLLGAIILTYNAIAIVLSLPQMR